MTTSPFCVGLMLMTALGCGTTAATVPPLGDSSIDASDEGGPLAVQDADLGTDGVLNSEVGAGTDTGVNDAIAAPAGTRKGISGWIYVTTDALANKLIAYDKAVQAKSEGGNRRVRYLFPYAGALGITGTTFGTHTLSYKPSASAFYATRLPYAAMLPIIDSADGANFKQWSAADQAQLAIEVSKPILADPNAVGLQIDIEPFDPATVPFYTKLRALLNGSAKVLTAFTGRTNGAIYGAVDIVVLSGYDLGITPLTTINYTTTLAKMVSKAVASAKAGGSTLLVGVPASASHEEYATQSGTCHVDTGYTQEQWLQAAWKAVCPSYFDSAFLGLALWKVGDSPLATPHGSTCLRNPGDISDSAWTMLADFDPKACP
ncbi:MAG: hypothetical protein NVS3B20_10190 [Polyangiales bacterium]